ncbi:MAG: cytochrome c3 family protein, partial [Nitrospinota bacterium]
MKIKGSENGRLSAIFPLISFIAAAHLFVLSLPDSVAAEDVENVCVDCHIELDDYLKQVVIDWRDSIHVKAGVFCHDCHGGNPSDSDVAMDEEEGFKGKPEPAETPSICARCHSDPGRMRAGNLPFDQFQKYKSSVHGIKLLKENDNEAPNCQNCHGSHKILRVSDPKSPANRSNIVKTCGGCHSNSEIMKKRKLPFNQYELYKKSVHGKPYFETGDLGVPTCIDCHGNHGIKKPDSLAVRLVCVKCHIDQEEYYKKSAHWAVAKLTGKPVCEHCHSNHSISPPSLEMFAGTGRLDCGGCHDAGSMPMETAAEIAALLKETGGAMEAAKERLETLSEWSGSGFETSHLTRKVNKAEKSLNKMAFIQHSLNVDMLKKEAVKVDGLSNEVSAEVERM